MFLDTAHDLFKLLKLLYDFSHLFCQLSKTEQSTNYKTGLNVVELLVGGGFQLFIAIKKTDILGMSYEHPQ